MPEYLAPGVYVEEVELGPKPIEGVSTSTTGFVGMAVRGPVNKPVLVTNVGEYQRVFGGYLDESYQDRRWLPYSVEGFFQNGGLRAYVVRVAKLPGETDTDGSLNAFTASTVLPNRASARRYLSTSAKAGDQEIDLPHWAGLAVGTGLRIGDGARVEYATIASFTSRVRLDRTLNNEHDAGATVMLVSAALTALAQGTANSSGSGEVSLAERSGVAAGAWVRIGEGAAAQYVRAGAGGGTAGAGTVAVTPALLASHATGTPVRAVTVPDAATGALAAAAAAEATAIRLDAAAAGALADGDWIQVLGNGAAAAAQAASDFVQIVGPVAEGADVTVAPALRFAHNAGREVRKVTVGAVASTLAAPTTLTLADATAVRNGDILILDDGVRTEFVDVSEAPAGGVVTAVSALAYAHAAGTAVRRFDSPRSTTQLSAASVAGSTEVAVYQRDDLRAGDVVELLDGPQTEYGIVKSSGAGAGTVTLISPLRYPHPLGTMIRELDPTLRIVAGPSRPNPRLHPEPGRWGNQLRVRVDAASLLRAEIASDAMAGAPFVQLRTVNGIEPGTILRLPGNRYAVVNLVEGNRVYLEGGVPAAIALGGAAGAWDRQVQTTEFRLSLSYGGTEEVFDNLSMDSRHSRYFAEVVNRASKLAHVTDLDVLGRATGPVELPLTTGEWYLGGGTDGTSGVTAAVYRGSDSDDADRRTGLHALLNVPDVSIVAVPGQTEEAVQQALIAHCERARYRFGVLDSKKAADLDAVQVQRSILDSKYAALYYPWIQVLDPLQNRGVFAPPSGHVAGIYARTDAEVGVHKAPANATIRQVGDLEATVTAGQQDILNPKGINAIRSFPGRGIRVWGARTISSDPSWRYVNVRRLFIFLEHSIDLSTQYAVFEPNDRPLWNRLRASLTSFLTTVWRSGALQGATAAEAFFVKVGLGETMTQDDIDAGRVIVMIGVAPVKPAEFVIFRIGQKVGGSEVAE